MQQLSVQFWRYLMLTAGSAWVVVLCWYLLAAHSRLTELIFHDSKRLELQAETLVSDFSGVVTDLLVLSESAALRAAVDSWNAEAVPRQSAQESSPDAQAAVSVAAETPRWGQVAEIFRSFVQRKRVYDQLRLLDLQGQELVRINYRNGQAQIVPPAQLQIKSDRYYVRETARLEAEEIFVSPFDLNVEDGKVETPIKPTIRLGQPVFDLRGNKRAILVMNLLGTEMLQRFVRLGSQAHGTPMLLNSSGYWFWRGDPTYEWGFMYADRVDQTFARWDPMAWRALQGLAKGSVKSERGLYSVHRLNVKESLDALGAARRISVGGHSLADHQWILLAYLAPQTLSQNLQPVRNSAWFLAACGSLAAVLVSWVGARWNQGRRQSEASLRASEARFRQMADHMSEAFWLGSANREELLYASPAFEQIWGLPPSHNGPLSAAWLAAVHPEDRPALHGLPGATAEPFELEYRIQRPNGQWRWIRDRGQPIPSTDQTRLHYVGIAADVTEARDVQQLLLRNERLAAVGEAIAGIAHESRNALQRAQACLEMLAKRVGDRPEVMSLAHRTQEALRDLHKLYERVREFSAPLQLRKTPQNLRHLWKQTCEDLAPLIQRRIAMITENPDPPDLSPGWQVPADALGIRQVFRNVLENALCEELDWGVARTEPRVLLTFHKTTLSGVPAVAVSVTDNGPGLAAELCERIFEPFYSTKSKGTGLGMAISRRIVAAHGGTLEAFPGTPSGLEIRMVLPLTLSPTVPERNDS